MKNISAVRVAFLAIALIATSGWCQVGCLAASTHGSSDKSATKDDKASPETNQESAQTFSGNASWYGIPFHGHKTASGEIFDMNKLSAAHLKLHMVSKVLVENPKNGKSAVVRVNDRGPYVHTRVLDLSRAAAMKVGTFPGVGYVECTVLNGKAPSCAP